jgi:diguanylate cyclase (GGDEF)-like protein
VNHLLIGISGALGICVAVLGALLALLSRRAGRRADARVHEVVRALEERTLDLAEDLERAVERAEAERRRNRFLGEIAGSIDLDDVLTRTLAAADALPATDAALIRIDSGPGKPAVAALGLSTEEAERQAVAGPPDRREARAVELGYRYPEEVEGQLLIRRGLAVPLMFEDRRLGYLTVFTRSTERRFDEVDVRRLEELADCAAPAIENAHRFREARELADLDALTGLHNRRYFHETLAREISRAQRYGRGLALVVLDLDDFKDVNDRIGHLAGDAVLAETAARLREVVRSADIACRVGGDEFAVIAPEVGLEDAHELVERIQRAMSSRPLGSAGPVRISAGIAELNIEDDGVTLFERADERLYAAKQSRKGGLAPIE